VVLFYNGGEEVLVATFQDTRGLSVHENEIVTRSGEWRSAWGECHDSFQLGSAASLDERGCFQIGGHQGGHRVLRILLGLRRFLIAGYNLAIFIKLFAGPEKTAGNEIEITRICYGLIEVAK
jgi:hypothetical protein